jgi:hypothetical protein
MSKLQIPRVKTLGKFSSPFALGQKISRRDLLQMSKSIGLQPVFRSYGPKDSTIGANTYKP